MRKFFGSEPFLGLLPYKNNLFRQCWLNGKLRHYDICSQPQDGSVKQIKELYLRKHGWKIYYIGSGTNYTINGISQSRKSLHHFYTFKKQRRIK